MIKIIFYLFVTWAINTKIITFKNFIGHKSPLVPHLSTENQISFYDFIFIFDINVLYRDFNLKNMLDNDNTEMLMFRQLTCDGNVGMILLRWYFCDDKIAMIPLRWSYLSPSKPGVSNSNLSEGHIPKKAGRFYKKSTQNKLN